MTRLLFLLTLLVCTLSAAAQPVVRCHSIHRQEAALLADTMTAYEEQIDTAGTPAATYPVEISLRSWGMSGSTWMHLRFDGRTWCSAVENSGHRRDRNAVPDPRANLCAAVDSLLRQRLFSLPPQADLELEGPFVDCGPEYTVTYRVGNRRRTYHFYYPEFFLEHNPRVAELQHYIAIDRIISRCFRWRPVRNFPEGRLPASPRKRR